MKGVLLVGIVLLAGCAGPQASSPGPATSPVVTTVPSTIAFPLPPTIEPATDLFLLRPQLVGCRAWGTNFDPLASDVEKLLPPGYQATGTAWPVLAAAHLEAQSCDAVIINTETVLSDVTIFAVDAPVVVNDTLADGADVQTYALEVLATDQTLVNLLAALGLRASLAAIDISDEEAPYEMRVSVNDELWYELSALPGSVYDAPESSYVVRYHQAAPTGALWYDHELTKTMTAFSGKTTMRIQGGVLLELDLADQGLQRAETWHGVSQGVLHFGKLL